jgi:hypothetical protein
VRRNACRKLLRTGSVLVALLVASCGSDTRSKPVDSETSETPSPELVGLVFHPDSGFSEQEREQLRRAVREVAAARFVGSSDTVDGHIQRLVLRESGELDSTTRYILLLPFGDRERPIPRDSAAVYVIWRNGLEWRSTDKLAIALGPGQSLHLGRSESREQVRTGTVVICVQDNFAPTGEVSITFRDDSLTSVRSARSTAPECGATGGPRRE